MIIGSNRPTTSMTVSISSYIRMMRNHRFLKHNHSRALIALCTIAVVMMVTNYSSSSDGKTYLRRRMTDMPDGVQISGDWAFYKMKINTKALKDQVKTMFMRADDDAAGQFEWKKENAADFANSEKWEKQYFTFEDLRNGTVQTTLKTTTIGGNMAMRRFFGLGNEVTAQIFDMNDDLPVVDINAESAFFRVDAGSKKVHFYHDNPWSKEEEGYDFIERWVIEMDFSQITEMKKSTWISTTMYDLVPTKVQFEKIDYSNADDPKSVYQSPFKLDCQMMRKQA